MSHYDKFRERPRLIYLASPFSHKDRWVMKLRWAIITAIGAKLVSEGKHVFGPITESHAYDEFGVGNSGWEYWQKHDYLMIDKADELWVVKMKGWEQSVGVQAELTYAQKKGKQIVFLNVEDVLPEIKEVI